jgi:hypothetical protein
MLILALLAQEKEMPSTITGLDPFVPYLNLGVIVVVLFLAYTRKVRFEGEVKEKDNEIVELKVTVKQYIEHYQKEVVPALIEVTRVSGELVGFLNRQRD